MQRQVQTIDASEKSLGRVAAQAAKILMGKHKPDYQRNIDAGDFVAIKNYARVKFTGDKMKQKLYYRPSRRPGRLHADKLADLWRLRPREVLKKAVWGMLPKNSLRRGMIKRLAIEL